MLPESVLEHLTRNTALQQNLVEMAWPDLSTESKLQIIVAAQSVYWNTADWLAKLAIDDAAPIIRYWGARCAYLPFRQPDDEKSAEEGRDRPTNFGEDSEEDKALYAKAIADPCEMVRLCTGNFRPEKFASLSQLQRLVIIRNRMHSSLGSLIEALEAGIAGGVPDSDLEGCVNEFFMRPDVRRKISPERNSSDAWRDELHERYLIRKAWALTKNSGPQLCNSLAFYLPTDGLDLETFSELPDEVVVTAATRPLLTEEISLLLKDMDENPGLYRSSIIEKVNNFRLYCSDSDMDIKQEWRRRAVNRSEAILETVLELQRQLTDIREAFQNTLGEIQQTLGESGSRRRGLFG